MMGFVRKFFVWACVTLVSIQKVWSNHGHQHHAVKNHENASIPRHDTTLSDVEAIYSTYKTSTLSEITYYGTYPGGGACALDPLTPIASQPGWIRVAAGRDDFLKSLGCGMCVEITGEGKGSGSTPFTGTVKAIIHDLCGGCKKGGFDLFIEGDGRWNVSSRSIECPTVQGRKGNIIFRFTGSNPWYIKLQARNVKIPVAGMEVLKNGKYSCLKRLSDNYFTGDKLGKVDLPLTVRVTSVSGEQRVAVLSSLTNDVDVFSDIQFKGISRGDGPSGIKCFGQGNKSPYPSGGLRPSEETGSISAARSTSTASSGNKKHAQSPNEKKPTSETVKEGGNGDFCENKESGVHPHPDDCRGFILCNAGKTYRKKCAKGLLFNPTHLACDLPARVKCRRGRKARIGQAAKRGKLNFAGKPAVEIVIQKEKMQNTRAAASNTEGIQAIRPNEENIAPEDGNMETGAWSTAHGSRGGSSSNEEQQNESGIPPVWSKAAINNTNTGERVEERAGNWQTQTANSPKDGNGFAPVITENNTDAHSSKLRYRQWGESVGTANVDGIRKPAEKGGGEGTSSTEVKGAKEAGAPTDETANMAKEGFQGGIITELPPTIGNTYISHEGRGDTSGATNVSTNNNPMSKVPATGPVGNTADREKSSAAMSQSAETSNVPSSAGLFQGMKESPEGSLQTQSQQELNKGTAPSLPHEGAHAAGPQGEWNSGSLKTTEKGTSSALHGSEAGVPAAVEASKSSGQDTAQRPNSNEGSVDLVTLEGVETSRPAVSKEKEKPAPLVGITIKQTGQPDKYVLVNKRHKLRAKHHKRA